jgi:NTP pyrophosphatase (non-canonical NTP hydrolase)
VEQTTELMVNTWTDILRERKSQNEKWGLQRHTHLRWYAILGEEVGEVAEALQKDMVSAKGTDADDLYKELIQVAAVACAFAEQVREENA